MRKIFLLVFFCLSLYTAKAQQLFGHTNVDSVRFELVHLPNAIYRFDKSTGEVFNIVYKSTAVDPLNESQENLLTGIVKYCLYFDRNSNLYLLNLKTGKVYHFEPGSSDFVWKPI